MSRRTRAAVSPPRDPPTTATVGMPATRAPLDGQGPPGSGPAERGHRVDLQLEEHTALVEGRVAQAVDVAAGVLLEDLVQLCVHPLALPRVLLRDLADDGRLDAEPVVGVLRVHQEEGRM